MADDLRTVLSPLANSAMADYMMALMPAWAAATREAAPVLTGALAGSVRAVSTGPLSCELRMRFYGRFVQGGHAVGNWNTSARRHGPGSAAYNRRHPLKTTGFVAANPFISRAITVMQPSGEVPPSLVAIFKAVAEQALAEAMTGKG
jgi:hypothetical protein